MKLKVLFLFALALLTSQLSVAQETITTADLQRGYLIGPGDIITIKVLGEPDFTVEAITVDEDGKIQVPYSEGVVAQCQTEKSLRDQVVKVYSKLIRNPQVNVYVKERNSRPPATVYGQIKTPQRVILTRKATLQDLLAFSGGTTDKASGMIQITHTQPVLCSDATSDDWKTLSANGTLPSKLYSLGSLKETNPEIYPGDIINVLDAPPVYVIGEVMKAGEVTMPEGGLPLTQAIAMASGTTREAQKKEVKIYRRKPGTKNQEIIVVNYDAIKKGTQKDVMLEPLDIVEVGKAKKSVMEVVLDIATGGVRNVVNTLPVRY